ncbi:MAG TPA: anti-sigma factor, partial [Pyrinomonadaceae bacterium]|nr:anti-sigma factor [Pyrinomonadaceae bacterium]
MSGETQDILFDLLTTKAIYGLDEAGVRQLDELDPGTADLEFYSLELAAAAISMVGLEQEPLPAHLRSKIISNAEQYFSDARTLVSERLPPVTQSVSEKTVRESSGGSWFSWFGWAAAAMACIALAANIWFTRFQPKVEVAQINPPATTPRTMTPAELRDQMMNAATDTIKAAFTVGNMKELTQVVGDVVWSDDKQTGYMRVQGLPVNDASKATYQLWIFDKTQDKETPIDGGTFDVTSNGE